MSKDIVTQGSSLPTLADINQQILAPGEHLPAVRLANGLRVQTGTVATMLHNVARYNAGERGPVEQELLAAVPTLVDLGMFDLFPAAEWINGDNSGRAFVGKAAQEYAAGLDSQHGQ